MSIAKVMNTMTYSFERIHLTSISRLKKGNETLWIPWSSIKYVYLKVSNATFIELAYLIENGKIKRTLNKR